MTDVIGSIAALRDQLSAPRRSGRSIALVPTMGALHAGHMRLIEVARAECDLVVVSIFVNPLQFDRPDDLARYPRTLDADVASCASLGVHAVFAPDAVEMYPLPPACVVEVKRLADHLCGRFRPGHFAGMATVVMKLFQIVQPDRAYFGEKDAQQLAIIRRMVDDLDVPLVVVGIPTVREADGLAMSSRNRLLSREERVRAVALIHALNEAKRLIATGARSAADIVARAAEKIPKAPGITLEYLEIVDPSELQPVGEIAGPVLVAGAMWVGSTRLIDNVLCSPP